MTIRIDELDTTNNPSLQHVFAAMKDGLTVQLSVQQVHDLIRTSILGGATPEELDTFFEIAQSLGEDPDLVGTINADLATRLKVDGSNVGGNAAALRTALALGALATKTYINDLDWSGSSLAVTRGGHGGTTAAQGRDNLGITALFDETMVDDMQVQTIGTAVSAVDFTVPATGGAFFLIITDARFSADAAWNWRTNQGAGFSSGATDYQRKTLWGVALASTADTQDTAGLVAATSFKTDSGANLIPSFFMGIFTPGSASIWPMLSGIFGGYTTTDAYGIGAIYGARRNIGRVTQLRFSPSSGTLTRGTYILGRIRGA